MFSKRLRIPPDEQLNASERNLENFPGTGKSAGVVAHLNLFSLGKSRTRGADVLFWEGGQAVQSKPASLRLWGKIRW